MATPLLWLIFSIVLWAWFNPHDLGKWIDRVKDPHRQKPIHQKKRGGG